MICKKCGTENPNDFKFCEKCGVSTEFINDEPLYAIDLGKKEEFIPPCMEEEEKFEDIKIAPKKKLSIAGKIGITIGAILIVFVIVFLSLGAYMTNPENIVSRNFESFIEEDYDSIYYDIDIPASDFTKKEAFVKNYDQMLMNTGMMNVEEVASQMGIDVTKKDFWIESLKFIEEDIDLFEKLLKETKAIK